MAFKPKQVWTAGKIVKVSVAGLGGFAVAQLLLGSESFYGNVVMPTIHKCVDPETAHRLAVKAAEYHLLPRFGSNVRKFDQLQTTVFGLHFSNPIGKLI